MLLKLKSHDRFKIRDTVGMYLYIYIHIYTLIIANNSIIYIYMYKEVCVYNCVSI